MRRLMLLGLIVLSGCTTQAMPPLPRPPADSPVQVALVGPVYSELGRSVGQTMRNGSLIALDPVNRAGGVLGESIGWQAYDTDCSYDGGVAAVEDAVAAGIDFIVGPLCTEAAIGAAVTAQANGVVMVTLTAGHPLITADATGEPRSGIFSVAVGATRQARAMAQLARDQLAVERAVVVRDATSDASVVMADAFTQQFGPADVTVWEDMRQLPDVAALGSDEALYLPGMLETVQQMPLSPEVVILGDDSWSYLNVDHTLLEGSYFPVHFAPADPTVQAWIQQYESVYAGTPDAIATLSHDATAVLLQAMAQAGSFAPEAVASALETGAFETVTGVTGFDAQHMPIKPVPVVQIQVGNLWYTQTITP